uniref:6-Hydroxy-7-prenyldeoxybrevianamide E synthase notC n=1 Tax=Aspergillus sp. (strain MF297-2) TaxID=877550 RepID=NOTC_ASPSM|nr:RecName: Full=6-Hydroxy-7-prenyldeoxybrevianamide E synthase notC; AltName: Full=Notoamide biosynthesis cluster protein C; AltName: Full=Prenyltransferase notC [Aspergillus sp. MF297-2]ADM34131.1 normal prenyltransferase [Aspergillus sp. MF297-2]ADM34136.1 aromatic prenyl-transferase [Aspergillus sp. MF297-2]
MAIEEKSTSAEPGPYDALSRFSSLTGEDDRKWWEHTGPVLEKVMRDSGYELQSQYIYLYFVQQHLIPYLGKFPTRGQDDHRWQSNLTPYKVPYELSWNVSHKVVRISWDPVCDASGTENDAFNKKAIHDCTRQLAELDSTVILDRYRLLHKDLVITDEEEQQLLRRDVLPKSGRGQHNLAVDFQEGGITLKVYFYPYMKFLATGTPIEELFFSAIEKLRIADIDEAVGMLKCFLSPKSDDGKPSVDEKVFPSLLACDLCDPSKSRIKYYVIDKWVKWERIANLWTIGGRRLEDPYCAKGLALLKELWDLLAIPEGDRGDIWPNLVLGQPPTHLMTTIANYTLSPASRFPEPQVYLTTFGLNDMAIIDALTAFYERVGFTDMAKSYKKNVQSYYPNLDLNQTNWVHEAVSFSYRNSKPYLSVYYSPF